MREVYTNSPLEWYILGEEVDWSEFDSWEKRWTIFVLDWDDGGRFIDEDYGWWVMRKNEQALEYNGKIKRKRA